MSKRLLIAVLLNSCFSFAFTQSKTYLLIGTYTSGKSEGIYVYNFDSSTGDNSFVSSTKIANPSYLAVSPNNKMIYSVSENADSAKFGFGGSVSAFSFDNKKGTLQLINQQSSGGKHPCYVTVDYSGKWVFAANYSSGSAELIAVNKDGSLGAIKQVLQDTGGGPNKERQEGPHVHSTMLSPNNDFLFTPDLGTDRVMIYHFDKNKGILSAANPAFAQSIGGSGPRHLDFHPTNRYAYLVEEMSGTVVAFAYKTGQLKSIQRISALPANFNGLIGSADIHVSSDGKFLYCSNRGTSNSITIFKIDSLTGKLTILGEQSSMGKSPRNFNFDPTGNFLLVANMQSNDIVIFKIDKKTGLLTDTHKRINIPNPVCIKWIH
jgi:6-phosphogluconolactonase